jgi:hypothetical protein
MGGGQESEVEAAGTGFPLDYELPQASFDARTVARLARAAISTINVWISRDVFPNTTVGQQGRPRFFTANFAFHIAMTAELVGLGLPAPTASNVVIQAFYDPKTKPGPESWLVVTRLDLARFSPSRPVYVFTAANWMALAPQIGPLFATEANGLTIVDTGAIWRRVHDAALGQAAKSEKADD